MEVSDGLNGGAILFAPVDEDHVGIFHGMLNLPHVFRSWAPADVPCRGCAGEDPATCGVTLPIYDILEVCSPSST